MLDRIFNKWSKWELVEENKPYLYTKYNYITEWESKPTRCMVNIYRRTNKYTGMQKFKKVIVA